MGKLEGKVALVTGSGRNAAGRKTPRPVPDQLYQMPLGSPGNCSTVWHMRAPRSDMPVTSRDWVSRRGLIRRMPAA